MAEKYNIRSPHPVRISQMRVGDIGFIGGGSWHKIKGAFFTASDRFLYPEDDTHVVMVKKTVDGLFCAPIPWMEKLVAENKKDLDQNTHWVRFVPVKTES